MMLGRMSRKARPVVREKSGGCSLWRMFCPDFKGKDEVLACVDGEEGFNYTIRDNFRFPEVDAMEAVLPQGKGVPGGGAAAGGSSVGSKPSDGKKRKGDAYDAGGSKGPKLRRTQTAAIPQPKPEVTTAREEPVNVFATPPSSPKAVETHKEDKRSPSIEVVTLLSVHAEDTAKKPAVQTIDDTLDLSNNLIDPHDAENRGG
ncbi:hypothetical protein Hdeb2414_s0006g00222731 [Helianthus debilis subsp. tardiflorus]